MTAASPATDRPAGFAAVVLSGGTGARLGGADKATLDLGGATLLDQALAAVAAAEEVVVVGPRVETARAVAFVLEDPPGGGPAAGLLAGLASLSRDFGQVVVLAVDMPYVDATTIARLLAALEPGVDGAFLVDGDGRRQLAGALRPERLAPPVGGPASWQGLPLHRLLDGLALAAVPALGREAVDVDTWEDLRDLRAQGPA